MPPKRKSKNKTNSQAKLKYINTCITHMIDSLPRQTFDHIMPHEFESVDQENEPSFKRRKSAHVKIPFVSSQPVCVDDVFLSYLPRHPNIHVSCSFCKQMIPSLELTWYMEQPHSRRRYTPMCEHCATL